MVIGDQSEEIHNVSTPDTQESIYKCMRCGARIISVGPPPICPEDQGGCGKKNGTGLGDTQFKEEDSIDRESIYKCMRCGATIISVGPPPICPKDRGGCGKKNGTGLGDTKFQNFKSIIDDLKVLGFNPDETDLGNARRFEKDHKDDLLYCFPWNAWLEWDGVRYKRDETGRHLDRAEKTVLSMVGLAISEADSQRRSILQRHARSSQSVHRIEAMVKLAKPKMAITPDSLDRHVDLLATKNCIIDLRAGTPIGEGVGVYGGNVQSSFKELLITRATSAGFFHGAKLMECPTWNKCIETWTGGDGELASWLQKAIGYSITGRIDEEVFFVIYGPTRSGKTKFLRAIADALGEYSDTIRPEVLMRQRVQSDRADPEVAKLAGVRLVMASEAEDDQKFAEGKIKRMTGGEKISVRNVYEHSFQLNPQFKLWLSTNYRPETTTDPAVWERLIAIPFENVVPFQDRDKQLLDKLHVEQHGILQWAIDGAVKWYKEGLRPLPKLIESANQAYRDDSNPLREWLLDNIDIRANAEIQTSWIYNDYKEWSRTCQTEPISKQKFGRVLTDLGFKDRRGTGGRHFRHGLVLKGQGSLGGDDSDR